MTPNKLENPIEKYCRERGYQVAAVIDEKMALVVKPRPWWLPRFIWRAVIRRGTELIKVQ